MVTTSGTATANLYPAVIEADMAATPLLLLTADRPHRLRGTDANQTIDQLKLYGLPGTDFARFPGRTVWDGIKGELWEIKPRRQKLASYQDMTAMLASGSSTADVKAELVWVGSGTAKEMQGMDLVGKIVVTVVLADRAAAYGMPGETVDGMNLEAVVEAAERTAAHSSSRTALRRADTRIRRPLQRPSTSASRARLHFPLPCAAPAR